nr:ATP-binding cassette domain-containing protein [Gammaproteobacteria bacterium]
GKSVIIISHKLNEVMEISDRVTILRKGCHIKDINTNETNQRELADLMVGKKLDLKLNRLKIHATAPTLEIRNLKVLKDDGSKAIDDLSFFLRGGQILGVAGLAGCGQKEMCEAIVGLRNYQGKIIHCGKPINTYSLERIRELGIYLSFIPEDGLGIAPNLSVTDNLLLKNYKESKGIFVDRTSARKQAEYLIERYNIITPSTETKVKDLSGGNVQKILVGREIGTNPSVLITEYPVRGLDVNSSYMIYDILNQEKEKNTAILFIGEDLDVLLTFCDKIMVLHQGKNMGIIHTKDASKEEIGLMMMGSLDLTNGVKNYGYAKDSSLTEKEWAKIHGNRK